MCIIVTSQFIKRYLGLLDQKRFITGPYWLASILAAKNGADPICLLSLQNRFLICTFQLYSAVAPLLIQLTVWTNNSLQCSKLNPKIFIDIFLNAQVWLETRQEENKFTEKYDEYAVQKKTLTIVRGSSHPYMNNLTL